MWVFRCAVAWHYKWLSCLDGRTSQNLSKLPVRALVAGLSLTRLSPSLVTIPRMVLVGDGEGEAVRARGIISGCCWES